MADMDILQLVAESRAQSTAQTILQDLLTCLGRINASRDSLNTLNRISAQARRAVLHARDLWHNATNNNASFVSLVVQLENIQTNVHRLEREAVQVIANAMNLMPAMEGKRNRPKRRKTCLKRHMKWNSDTKRCNKKSKAKARR